MLSVTLRIKRRRKRRRRRRMQVLSLSVVIMRRRNKVVVSSCLCNNFLVVVLCKAESFKKSPCTASMPSFLKIVILEWVFPFLHVTGTFDHSSNSSERMEGIAFSSRSSLNNCSVLLHGSLVARSAEDFLSARVRTSWPIQARTICRMMEWEYLSKKKVHKKKRRTSSSLGRTAWSWPPLLVLGVARASSEVTTCRHSITSCHTH